MSSRELINYSGNDPVNHSPLDNLDVAAKFNESDPATERFIHGVVVSQIIRCAIKDGIDHAEQLVEEQVKDWKLQQIIKGALHHVVMLQMDAA